MTPEELKSYLIILKSTLTSLRFDLEHIAARVEDMENRLREAHQEITTKIDVLP